MTLHSATVRRLAILTLLACVLLAVPQAPADAGTAAEIRTGIEERINRARDAGGLRPLRVHTKLQRYSQDHAARMGRLNSLFHDTTGLWSEAPTDTSWVGENVGVVPAGPGAARRMHKAYMNSKLHKANILRPRATHMGIGVAKRNGQVWTVERFADLR